MQPLVQCDSCATTPGALPSSAAALRRHRLVTATRGLRRLGRAMGLASALVFALLLALREAWPLAQRLTAWLWNATIYEETLPAARADAQGLDPKIGLSQFLVFVATLLIVLSIVGGFAITRVLLSRVPFLRIPAALIDVLVAALACRAAQGYLRSRKLWLSHSSGSALAPRP